MQHCDTNKTKHGEVVSHRQERRRKHRNRQSYTHTHTQRTKQNKHTHFFAMLHSEDMKQSNLYAICLEHCATTQTELHTQNKTTHVLFSRHMHKTKQFVCRHTHHEQQARRK